MAQQSLKEVLDDLVADPAAREAGPEGLDTFLADRGHPDLDPALVAEAMASFAATLPVAAAEHLSSFLVAASPIPGPADADPTAGPLEALLDVPVADLDASTSFDDAVDDGLSDFGAGHAPEPAPPDPSLAAEDPEPDLEGLDPFGAPETLEFDDPADAASDFSLSADEAPSLDAEGEPDDIDWLD